MRTFSIATVVFSTALAGCAAQVVSSSPRTVVVKAGSLDIAKAQPLADQECGKHSRHARLAGHQEETMQWIFDCVQ